MVSKQDFKQGGSKISKLNVIQENRPNDGNMSVLFSCCCSFQLHHWLSNWPALHPALWELLCDDVRWLLCHSAPHHRGGFWDLQCVLAIWSWQVRSILRLNSWNLKFHKCRLPLSAFVTKICNFWKCFCSLFLKVSGRHWGDAGLASQCDLQIPVEIYLPTCYAGAAGSHRRSHGHHTPHLHGMERRESKWRKKTTAVWDGRGRTCFCLFSVVESENVFSQQSKTSTALGSAAKSHVASWIRQTALVFVGKTTTKSLNLSAGTSLKEIIYYLRSHWICNAEWLIWFLFFRLLRSTWSTLTGLWLFWLSWSYLPWCPSQWPWSALFCWTEPSKDPEIQRFVSTAPLTKMKIVKPLWLTSRSWTKGAGPPRPFPKHWMQRYTVGNDLMNVVKISLGHFKAQFNSLTAFSAAVWQKIPYFNIYKPFPLFFILEIQKMIPFFKKKILLFQQIQLLKYVLYGKYKNMEQITYCCEITTM